MRQQRVETAHREGGVLRRKPLWILPAFLGGDKELASSGMASRNLSGTLCSLPPLSTQPAGVLWGTWSRECSGTWGQPWTMITLCLGMGAKDSKGWGRVPAFPQNLLIQSLSHLSWWCQGREFSAGTGALFWTLWLFSHPTAGEG